ELPQLTAGATENAQPDPLAEAVPHLPLDVDRALRRGPRFSEVAQPEVGIGDIRGGLGLRRAVAEFAADRERLLAIGDRRWHALHAVGHAKVVEHPGL